MTEAEILKSLVKRIEAVREEKKLLAGSERDLFAEAKGKNIDGKALRRVLQRRAMDDADREAFDDLVDQYEHALGSKAAVRAAVASGASVREAAKIANVSHGVAQRAARGVPKNANTGTDRAGTDDGAPVGGSGRVAPAAPPDAIPPSSAVVASIPEPLPRSDVEASPPAALDTPDPEYLADAARNYGEAIGAIRAGIVERGEARLDAGDIPAHLRVGTPENRAARGRR